MLLHVFQFGGGGLVSLRRGCEWTHWGFLNTTEAVVCRGNGNKGEGGKISASLESPDVSLKWSPAKLICSVSPTGFSESQKAVFLKLSPQGDNDLSEFQSLPGAFNFTSSLKASTRAGPSNPLHTQPFSFSELLATANFELEEGRLFQQLLWWWKAGSDSSQHSWFWLAVFTLPCFSLMPSCGPLMFCKTKAQTPRRTGEG